MKSPNKAPALLARLSALPRTALYAVLGIVVLAVVGLTAMSFLGGDEGDASSAPAPAVTPFHAEADALATKLGQALAPYAKAAADVAANPDVQRALAAGDADSRNTAAAAALPPLDGVLAMRLLPPDTRDPDPAAQPPLTYAAIAMVIQARDTGKDVPAEAHLIGKPEESLEFVKRVDVQEGGAAKLAGFVLLTVKADVLSKAFAAAAPPDDAYVEVRQSGGAPVAKAGVKPATETVAISEAHVPGTRFAVAWMEAGAPPAMEGGVSSTLLILIAVGVLGVGAGVGGVMMARRRAPAAVLDTSGDQVIYQGAIRAILDGAHPGLEQLLPGARKGGDTTDLDLDVFGERADADDVTRIKVPGKSGASANGSEDPTVPRPRPPAPPPPGPASAIEVNEVHESAISGSIFRTYDIRGIVGITLTEESVYEIGRALGAEADRRGQKTVVVARDGRHSSEPLMQALTNGLLESGRDVLDIGLAPTPVLYFATHHLDAHSGVMITGSHNSPEYNGLKIVLDGETLSGEAIHAIRRRVEEQDYIEGTGSLQSTDIVAEYIRRISEEIPVTLGNALKVVVDCGNGVPGMVAPAILRAIGHDVIELFCEVDGDFPNHHPDPSQPKNLQQLIAAVEEEGADLGLAFDGDGDRLGVVDNEGNIIWPDRQMILFARDLLSRNPGAKIIYDVKCSRHLGEAISAAGGEPIMAKSGHSLIKARMQETGALLGGEMTGHIFFKERWYGFDDALYAAARLLEILVNSGRTPAEVFAELPGGVATPELYVPMPEEEHAEFMERVLAAANFDYAEINTLDGLRVDFVDSWGLIRPSNTTPNLMLRFEGDDAASLADVKDRFRRLLQGIDPTLELPF